MAPIPRTNSLQCLNIRREAIPAEWGEIKRMHSMHRDLRIGKFKLLYPEAKAAELFGTKRFRSGCAVGISAIGGRMPDTDGIFSG